VQDLAEDAVDDGRRLGPLRFVEVRWPVVQPGQFGVVSEMLANAAKHADASVLEVDAEASGGTLRVCIRDNGIGGADPRPGSGLVG
jgi:signal transduction histidine kinase